jgi:FAD/FMN-containing dehydrogenase
MATTGQDALAQLAEGFGGQLLAEGDAGYDEARAVFNGMIDRRPALVARCSGPADVVSTVRYAREQNLPIAVRCGGHSVSGHSAGGDGSVLVDLSPMKGVRVDPEGQTARANGGVQWGEYDRETQAFGLATPGGRVTTTGVGGFTLGGGYGWLSPVHGLTCDNLVGADVVTADGRFLHVSEDEHPDLLWALRGAGANFGVVTAYELRLHRIEPELLAGLVVIPNTEEAGDVVRGYRAVIEQADERLVTALATILAPPEDFVPKELVGKPMLGVVMCWVGDPAEGAEAMRPLRDMLAGGLDLVQPMPYTALQAMLDGFAPRGWLNYHRGQHLVGLTDEVIEPYLAVGRDIGSPMTQGIVFRHAGAVSRVAEDATAAGNRSAPYMAHPIACWATPEEGAHEMKWVESFSRAFGPALSGGTYLNFEPGTTSADVRAGFGDEKLRRLVALKDRRRGRSPRRGSGG